MQESTHAEPVELTSEQIVALRPEVVRPLASRVPVDVLIESEAADVHGNVAEVTTILLRGSECSFRCAMCDLWKTTHHGATPTGNLPAQIDAALRRTGSSLIRKKKSPTETSIADTSLSGRLIDAPSSNPLRWVKLYNASNFFAPYNVPTEDLPQIASRVRGFDRVIVENHPRLVVSKREQIQGFTQILNDQQTEVRLEVAMGLETVEPKALRRLNKQMTVDDVARAVECLHALGVDVRMFVLLRLPGMSEAEGIEWCLASIDAARGWGVRHVSIIPVRGGNGAMEHYRSLGMFEPPSARSLETVLSAAIGVGGLVITADLWEWGSTKGTCNACRALRLNRLEQINLTQRDQPAIQCNCS